jgi:DNA-binding response OmpR family regulator
MPKVTGVDLVKKARAAGLALPIVMATAKAPAWGFIQQSAVEPVLVLLKPYTFDEFLTAVKKVLRTSAQTSNEPTPPPNWQNHFPAARMRG